MRKSRTSQPHWFALGVLGAAMASATQCASAQESMLAGLGWHKNSAGTEMDGQSSVQLQGNVSRATITSSGGKGSALANAGMSVDLAGTAQANAVGLASMSVKNAQVQVLKNQVSGFVNAMGGAATVNVVLAASGEGRKPLSSTRLLVMDNKASQVDAFGGKASVLLGTGSLQLPGRATANSILLDASEVHESPVSIVDNEADDVVSIGGSALVNALTAARSQLRDTQIGSSGNRAQGIRAGGGSAGIGRGMIGGVNLTGVAAANTVAIAGSDLRGARLSVTDNMATQMASTGGSALANSISFTDHQLTAGGGYGAQLTNNTARNVQAFGGEGSLLGGALADVSMSASALANAISVNKGALKDSPSHTLVGNRAQDVVATGGGASANSLWLDNATVQGGSIRLGNNVAEQVRTSGISGSVGAGVVGAVEKNGRALGNTVAVDRQATLDRATLSLQSNEGRGITGTGGFAAANSVAVSEGRIQNSNVTLVNNRASQMSSTGGSAQVGGSVLYSTSQQSSALANTLAVTGSQLDAKTVTFAGNQAGNLHAKGGILMANSVSLEDGGGASSQLSASGSMMGNTAQDMSSAARSTSAAAGLARNKSSARAAANALVLHDDARMDASSPWLISMNDARQVHVDGGTALVNALAAYRGARVENSSLTILGNRAQDIRASGGASQVAGLGSSSNGVLAANSLYMDGTQPNRLTATQLQIMGNTARQLNADGGRINANAVSLNGQGRIEHSTTSIFGNTATDIRSEGKEGTVAGFAAFGKGVGQANANAIQVLSAMRQASLQLMGNTARNVSSPDGLASANSITQADGAGMDRLHATLAANVATEARADGGRTALANGVHADGNLSNASVQVVGNQGSAQTAGDDALVNSVRAQKRGRISESSVSIAANRGSASGGRANSVDVAGNVRASQITVMGNQGSASQGGTINSVTGKGQVTASNITVLGNTGSASRGTANSVDVAGSIAGSQLAILGNQGNAQGGGTVNSVTGKGSIKGSQISIIGNSGSTRGGGTVNSVDNGGSIAGASITLVANNGSATGGGTVNSVDNKGLLSGNVVIAGNRGSATMGGTVNSLVNRGVMAGSVVIAGNDGRAMAGGTSNSVINHGVITGMVAIVGNRTMAAAGMTSGSVRNIGGAIVGAAGVAGNSAYAANVGYTYATPSVGVVNNSVTVVPAFNIISN